MKKETKIYKVGDKIEYSFTEVLDFRQVIIEEIRTINAKEMLKFKDKTGWWPSEEKYIKQPDFKPGRLVKKIDYMTNLILV